MLFKKHFEQKSVNGVQMGNGTIAFRGIKLNVYSYFTDGVLIDTGSESLEKFFKPYFKRLPIEKVMITHFHEDHTGCAHFLQEEMQLPVFMNDTMIEYCTQVADYPLYRKMFWGKRKPFRAEAIGDSFQSEKSEWKVIQTPGHAIDHVSFLNEGTGQLFTGDLYCQEKTKVALREENIQVLINSLERVLSYDFEDVFCNHAGYLENGRVALQRKLEYLLDVQGNVLRLHEEGKTPEEIKAILFPKNYPITRFSFGEWDSIHIVHSIIKHEE